MSNKYKDFADAFIADYVNAEGYPPEGDMQLAREYATRCKLRAEKEGMAANSFEIHLGVTLEKYIHNAIIAANDAEVERLASKDS
ncbi:hypothetical protein [Hyphococcus luteus]|uniref:Uncharacterized protein n=1 Tax=Hyphococcus luteus TaxID=2058213 RepID=A0A2S7KB13_9PROT|nr:hypothetical protein [Marinicaulis flavus]PQA89657.1 hypothetical protein CW354_01995 [Marinicaulis flavus]